MRGNLQGTLVFYQYCFIERSIGLQMKRAVVLIVTEEVVGG